MEDKGREDILEYEYWLSEEEAKVRDPLPEDFKLRPCGNINKCKGCKCQISNKE